MSHASEQHHVTATVTVAVLGVFCVYLPVNAVAAALHDIAAATGARTAQLQWVSDAYVIPMAAAVLSAGVFGDLYGRRRVFALGLALTGTGGTLAVVAGLLGGGAALPLLWAGQAVSGLGAGLLLPTTLALIAHAVPDEGGRGRCIGWWAAGVAAGLALGPLVSGALLAIGAWGWVFLPAAVLSFATLGYGYLCLPESKSPEGRRPDWPGQLTAALAIAALVLGVIEGGARGWTSAVALAGLAVGTLALAAFLAVERRAPAPLMDLRLFASPGFATAGFASVIALFSTVGFTFLLSLYLGDVHHYSALDVGLRLFLFAGVSAVVNVPVGYLMGRVPPLVVLTAGLALGTAAVFLFTGVVPGTGFGGLAWRLALFGVAVSLMLTSVTVVSVNAAPWHLAGMASATSTALRQFGGALSPAVLGSVYAGGLTGAGGPTAAFHTALVVTGALLAVGFLGCLAVLAAELPGREGP
ncbi:MFS transporter [Streptomyces sp. CRN 30]|uniref:MFS transporter n=1 Tax=Streptomyces sp. CRN 30 TaxID=3075613 RepID=UPI002A83890A|nr:MFS transporter [Streptomyces sp. CRN 30]